MTRQTCYIAGPYAGTTDDSRVVWLGRLAMAMGYAPVVIHPAIRLGDDSDADARSDGLDAAKAIAMGCDEAWCLLRDDGTMSDGCRHELYHRRSRSGTWAEWQAVARVLCPGLLEVASEPARQPARQPPPWVRDGDVADHWHRGTVASVTRMCDGWAWRAGSTGGMCTTDTDAFRETTLALIADGWELS